MIPGGEAPALHAEGPGWHLCYCVLVHGSGVAQTCNGLARKDEPFCADCEDRHPDAPNHGVVVRTRALAGQGPL